MTLDRHIRAAFRESEEIALRAATLDPAAALEARKRAQEKFLEVYALFSGAREQRNLPRAGAELTSPELLVLAAEAAVKNERFDLAAEVTLRFFLDAGGTEDQFLCRALFVQALVEGEKATPLHGAAAVRQRRHAISYILHALTIATAPANVARYAFLIYNASVYYWSIVRPLLRAGAARYAAPSMTKVVDALEMGSSLGAPDAAAAALAAALDAGNTPPPPGAALDATTRWRIQVILGTMTYDLYGFVSTRHHSSR